jgi:hypothetical protein
MRYLQVIFAALLLASSVTATACHSVGDVHVICKNGEVSALYVESPDAPPAPQNPECCPMAGFDAAAEPPRHHAQAQKTAYPSALPRMAHIIRVDAHASVRGPPLRLFF